MPRARPQGRPHVDPEAAGDSIRGFEAYAPDGGGEAVGVVGHYLNGCLAVFLEDFESIGRRYAVSLQKEHYISDAFLLLEGLGNLFSSHRPYPGYFPKFLGMLLDDVKRLFTEDPR